MAGKRYRLHCLGRSMSGHNPMTAFSLEGYFVNYFMDFRILGPVQRQMEQSS